MSAGRLCSLVCVLGKSPALTFLAQRQSLAVIYRRGTEIQASNLAGRLKRKDSAAADLAFSRLLQQRKVQTCSPLPKLQGQA